MPTQYEIDMAEQKRTSEIKEQNTAEIREVLRKYGIEPSDDKHRNINVGLFEFSRFFPAIHLPPRVWQTASGGLPFGEYRDAALFNARELQRVKPIKYSMGYQSMSHPAGIKTVDAVCPIGTILDAGITFYEPTRYYAYNEKDIVVMDGALYVGNGCSKDDKTKQGWSLLRIDERFEERGQYPTVIQEIIKAVTNNKNNLQNILITFSAETLTGILRYQANFDFKELDSFKRSTPKGQSILAHIADAIMGCVNGADWNKLAMLYNHIFENRDAVITNPQGEINKLNQTNVSPEMEQEIRAFTQSLILKALHGETCERRELIRRVSLSTPSGFERIYYTFLATKALDQIGPSYQSDNGTQYYSVNALAAAWDNASNEQQAEVQEEQSRPSPSMW